MWSLSFQLAFNFIKPTWRIFTTFHGYSLLSEPNGMSSKLHPRRSILLPMNLLGKDFSVSVHTLRSCPMAYTLTMTRDFWEMWKPLIVQSSRDLWGTSWGTTGWSLKVSFAPLSEYPKLSSSASAHSTVVTEVSNDLAIAPWKLRQHRHWEEARFQGWWWWN